MLTGGKLVIDEQQVGSMFCQAITELNELTFAHIPARMRCYATGCHYLDHMHARSPREIRTFVQRIRYGFFAKFTLEIDLQKHCHAAKHRAADGIWTFKKQKSPLTR